MKSVFLAYDILKEENYKKLNELYLNIKEEYTKTICLADTHSQRPKEIINEKEILERFYRELENGIDTLIVAVDTENNGVIDINHILEKLIKKARELNIEIKYYSLLSNSITIERENKVNFIPGWERWIMKDKDEDIISADTVEGPLEFNMNEKPKMVTICGSTKQKDQIMELKAMLEAKGYGVLTPEFNVKTISESIAFTIHKAKIDVSDAVYFLLKPKKGFGHEAGSGLQREIKYCILQEKEMVFVSPEEIRI